MPFPGPWSTWDSNGNDDQEDNEDRSGFHPEVPFNKTARKALSEYSNISNNYNIKGNPNEDLSDLGMDEFEAKMQAITAELKQ